MKELSVNTFRANLKKSVEEVINNHEPLKINRRTGKEFVIISFEDWQRDQETLYVIQNTSLMKQISESVKTHNEKKGYTPTMEELDEINSIWR